MRMHVNDCSRMWCDMARDMACWDACASISRGKMHSGWPGCGIFDPNDPPWIRTYRPYSSRQQGSCWVTPGCTRLGTAPARETELNQPIWEDVDHATSQASQWQDSGDHLPPSPVSYISKWSIAIFRSSIWRADALSDEVLSVCALGTDWEYCMLIVDAMRRY